MDRYLHSFTERTHDASPRKPNIKEESIQDKLLKIRLANEGIQQTLTSSN
eukprot:m.119704 g.119704  ORF g.119704 m.119704 type:complete len:50 (-) comp14328_c0_seq2:2265-2414(-)